DIWNRLISAENKFELIGTEKFEASKKMVDLLEDQLYSVYQNLKVEVTQEIQRKKDNRAKSYHFRKTRIEKIAIENIRNSKLKKLDKEYVSWLKEFNANRTTIPTIKHLLSLKIHG